MLAVQPRRLLSRPRGLLVFAVFAATLYWFLLHGTATLHATRWYDGRAGSVQAPLKENNQAQLTQAPLPANQQSSGDQSQYTETQTQEKTEEEKKKEAEEQREENLREQFDEEYEALAK